MFSQAMLESKMPRSLNAFYRCIERAFYSEVGHSRLARYSILSILYFFRTTGELLKSNSYSSRTIPARKKIVRERRNASTVWTGE